MRIKESNLHNFPELGINWTCSCGMTSDSESKRFIGWEWNRWFKVNGVQTCFHCVYEIASCLEEMLKEDE